MRLNFTHYLKLSLTTAILLFIAACGGGDETTDNSSSSNKPQPEQTPTNSELTLNANQLKTIDFQAQPMAKGKAIRPGTVSASVFNGTGEFTHPLDLDRVATFNGNISVAVKVSDPEQIQQLYLGFEDNNQAIVICEENCGTEFSAVVNGISPQLFGQTAGQLPLSLWVLDNEDTLQQIDLVTVQWQSKVISGVSVSLDEEAETLSVTWDATNEILRYNVYIANQAGLIGSNVNELEGGEAQLALTSTNATFTEKTADANYFVLVTGVDQTGESAYSDTVILISGIESSPPTANNDEFSGDEDTEITGSLIANDTIADGGSFSLVTTPVSTPSNGELVLNNDGTFNYLPTINFNGTDQFSYQIENTEGLTSSAVVTLTVNPVNDAPTAENILTIIAQDANTLEGDQLLSTASDIDGDQLSLVLQLTDLPQFGSVQVFADGRFSYSKGEAFTSFDSFVYQISDGTVTIENRLDIRTADFNGFPPIANPDTYQINEDGFLTVDNITGVLANDTDPDEQTVTLNETFTPPNHGTLELETDGSFSYRPNPNFSGSDAFIYQLTDSNNNTVSGTVTIEVTALNDAPNANNDSYTLANDQVFTIPRSLGLLKNDSDIDSNSIEVDVNSVTQPSNGTLQVNNNGSFTYTPEDGFTGTVSFTYQATDGELNSATASVQLHVVTVHADTDDLTATSISLAEIFSGLPTDSQISVVSTSSGSANITGTTLTYTPEQGKGDLQTITLNINIANTDVEFVINVRVELTNTAPEITSTGEISINENPVTGTVLHTIEAADEQNHPLTYKFSNDETSFVINSTTGEITLADGFALNFEQVQQHQIGITVLDSFELMDTQNLIINVIDVNETPVLLEDTAEVSIYSDITIDVLNNDSDPDNDPLTITQAEADFGSVTITEGGQLFYQPDNLQTQASVTYTAQDPEGLSAQTTVDITILPLTLTGTHDLNQDEVIDFDSSFNSDSNTWTLNFAEHIPLVSQVINQKYYPIEKQADGQQRISFTVSDISALTDTDATSTAQIDLIIDNQLYQLFVDTSSQDANFIYSVGSEPLSTDISDLSFPVSFIEGNEVWSGENVYQRLAVDHSDSMAAEIHFEQGESTNTGFYANERGKETFTWLIDQQNLTVTMDEPESRTETFSLAELLSEGAITQSQYDTLLMDVTLSGESEFSIGIVQPNVTVSVVNNVNLYLEVEITANLVYSLPTELGGQLVNVEESEFSKLYYKDKLGTFAFNNLDDTSLYLPVFHFIDGEPDSLEHQVASFNSDKSGTIGDTDVTWSIGSEGQLEISNDNFNYSYALLNGDTEVQEVLVQATNTDNSKMLSSAGFILSAQSNSIPTQAALNDVISDKILISGLYAIQANAYDEQGVYLAKELFGFELSSESPTSGPVDYSHSTRFSVQGEQNAEQFSTNQQFWQLADNILSVAQFIQDGTITNECNPATEANCLAFAIRNIEVQAVDETSNRIWVVESQLLLDFDSIADNFDNPVYTETISPRVNFYQISELATAVSEAGLLVNEDETISNIDMLSNDIDSQGGGQIIRLLGINAENGLLSINTDDSINYAPTPSFNGQDILNYLIVDAFNGLAIGRSPISITPVNDAPVATADFAQTDEGKLITITPLDNDTDLDGDPLTISSFTSPNFGSVTDTGDGKLSYQHDGSENFSDSFSYTLSDGTTTASATINIDIKAVNDAPTGVLDTADVDEGAQVLIDLLTNDTDPDSSLAELSVVNISTANFGSVSDNGDGTISYQHDSSESLSDSFTYQVTDGLDTSDLVTVNIDINPINDAAVITTTSNFNVAENTATSTLVLTATATDAENDSLSWSLTDINGIFSIDSLSGDIKVLNSSLLDFESLTGYNITVSVFDGTELSSQQIAVNIDNINEAPVITSGTNISIAENINNGSSSGYATTGFDPESETITWSLTDTNGVFTVDSNTGLLTVSNNSLLDFESFSPYQITLIATDSENNSGQINISVNVTNINESPILNLSALSPSNATEDLVYNLDLSSFVTDPDDNNNGTDLTWSLSGEPSGMTISTTGNISWTPVEGDTNSGTVTVIVADGGEDSAGNTSDSFSVAVTAVNDQPVLDLSSLSPANAVEDITYHLDLSSYLTDVDDNNNGTDLIWALSNAPSGMAISSTGAISWTPVEGDSTSGAVTVSVTDGGEDGTVAATDIVTIPVTAVNDPPMLDLTSLSPSNATEDLVYNLDLSSFVTDPDDNNNGTDLTWSLSGQPSGMSISTTGNISWTPVEGDTSSGTVTVIVADGGEDSAGNTSDSFSVSVTAVNDQPLLDLTSLSITNAVEDTAYNLDLSSFITDVDDSNNGSDLTWSISGQPSGMTISSTGTISWTPVEGDSTSGAVTVSVTDGGEDGTVATTDIVTIPVTPVNDAPVLDLTSLSPGTAAEDITYNLNLSSFVTDPDDTNNGTDLTWSLSGEPTGMTISSTGTINWTPVNGDTTSGTVTVIVADGGEDSAANTSDSFSVSVTAVNDQPVLDLTLLSVTNAVEDTAYNLDLSSFITDVDDSNNGSDLTWSISGQPSGMTISSTGNISWTPVEGDSTSGAVTVSVTDGGEDGTVATTDIVTIPVTAVNDAPMLDLTSLSPSNATEDITYNLDLSSFITDPDDTNNGTDLTWSLSGEPSGMSISTTGNISWTPVEGDTTSGTITVTVADGGEDSASDTSDTLSFSVDPVNDPAQILSGNTFNVAEGSTTVATINAVDEESDSLTYSITTSDPDHALFSINTFGDLIFTTTPDFESPTDSSPADNVYEVQVQVVDSVNGTPVTQSIDVTVTDVVENTELALDNSFGNNGLVQFNTFANTQATTFSNSDYLQDAVMDDSGNYFVLVDSDGIGSVSKIKPDGSFDTSFANNGRKLLDPSHLFDVNVQTFDDDTTVSTLTPKHLKVDTDSGSSHYGKVYVYGYQFNTINSVNEPFLLRLNTDGSIDDSFSSDGKHASSYSNDHSEATDLLIHSDGFLYLAVNSQNYGSGDGFKLVRVNSTSLSYNKNFAQDSELQQKLYVAGLVENSAGNITAFGYADDGTNDSIMRMVIDAGASPNISTSPTYTSVSTTDEISNYVLYDANHVIAAGKINSGNGSILAKININTLVLDTSFNSLGYYTEMLGNASFVEQIIDVATNNKGDISFVTEYTPVVTTNKHRMWVGQVDASGNPTSADGNFAPTAMELNENDGIANEPNVNAVLLHDTADTTNQFVVFSTFSNTLPSGNTQVQTYLKEFNSDATTELNRWQYDFVPIETAEMTDVLVTSSSDIISLVHRDNEMGETTGTTVSNHALANGTWDQTFGNQGTINYHAESSNSIDRYAEGVVELADGTLIVVTNEIGTSTYDITVELFNADGSPKTDTGFPITFNYTSAAYVKRVVANNTAKQILLVGEDQSQASSRALLIKIDATDASVIYNYTGDIELGNNIEFLTDAVLMDDGSAIVLGQTKLTSTREDGFLAKFSNAGVIDTNFDGDTGDSDDVLLVEFNSALDINVQQLEQLSDGSLIIGAHTFATSNHESYVMKVVEDSVNTGQYKIDTDFDAIDGTDGNDYIQLNLDDFDKLGNPVDEVIVGMAVNSQDQVYMIGSSDFTGHTLGWIVRIEGLTGDYGTFGNNSVSGHFVPGGREGCSASNNDMAMNICDGFYFDSISIGPNDEVIIGTIIEGPLTPEQSSNSAIFKFIENQDDTATSYTVNTGGA